MSIRVLIVGQTSLHWGRMEFGNIGNYYIIEPLIRGIHKAFTNVTIRTTLQLSNRFSKDEKLEVLPIELYYDFNLSSNLELANQEINLVENYLLTGKFNEYTKYIEEVINSDIVIDFSGDMWGDNANFLGDDRFEVGLIKILIAQKLGKKTVMLAGSPGPFNDSRTKSLAKIVYEGFTLVTNRDSISSSILEINGFDLSKTRVLPCPSFLFEPAKIDVFKEVFEKEAINLEKKYVIGFVICGWNFNKGPFDLANRGDSEFEEFAKAIEFVSEVIDANVILFSHSNGFHIPPKEFKLIHGRDYILIKQLERIIHERGIAKNVITLNGVYSPWVIKAIISQFDMLVSGRVHAAVAGFSQNIPTVPIDYGHEPIAHKIRGFAKIVEQEKYVSNPNSSSDMIEKIGDCFRNMKIISKELESIIPIVKNQSKENFLLLSNIVSEGSTL